MVDVSYGFTHVQEDVWLDYNTYTHVRCQELIPTDWPLSFHAAFLCACNELDLNMGDYTMGWEL